MFADVGRAHAVEAIVKKIEKDLEKNEKKPAVIASLKEVGRFSLDQLDEYVPNWVPKYRKLFK